jgi:ubiquinone/menaquinone biosynthesis C-methylase UbiE
MDASPRRRKPPSLDAGIQGGRGGVEQTLVGERLCERVALRWGARVLDVGTGSGSMALAAARRGARVAALDPSPERLAQARRRAAAENLPIEFLLETGESLPFGDASFDVVFSSFGETLDPEAAPPARELLRVCRHGGRLGVAAWTPRGFVGHSLAILDRSKLFDTDLFPSTQWGTVPFLRRRFGPAARSLGSRLEHLTLRGESPARAATDWLQQFDPVAETLDSMEVRDRDRILANLVDLYSDWNESEDSTFSVAAEYLETVIRRR